MLYRTARFLCWWTFCLPLAIGWRLRQAEIRQQERLGY